MAGLSGLLAILGFGWALSGDPSFKEVVAVRTVGDVPSNLVQRVSGWIVYSTCSMTNAGSLSVRKLTFKKVVKAVTTPQEGHVVLVLVNEIPNETGHIYGDKRVVVLNLAVMQPKDPRSADAGETFLRRVEKEAVGGIASMLGLPNCPMIHCALYAAGTVQELDEKSRSLCPPCQQKLEEMLKARPSGAGSL